ncbi:MAG: hypothetical protein ABIF17_02185 [Patescibacteria group bacterium]
MQKIIFFIFTFIIFIVPFSAHAGILPPCTATGNCGFCDMLYVINALMRWILYIAGAGALMFFIFGGFKFIYAAGDKGRIDSARKILWNTILGIAVVLFAWTGINLIISKTAGGSNKVIIYSDSDRAEWYNLCLKKDREDECASKGDGYPCKGFASHCERGVCVEGNISACDWLASQKGYNAEAGFDYACRGPNQYTECGFKEYSQCDTSPYCIKNLCPDTNAGTTVCCSPEPKVVK